MKLRRFRQPFESMLVLLAACAVPRLPRMAVLRLAAALGGLAYALHGPLRRVALANLECALGGSLPEPERRRVARGSFRASALVILDLFWFGRDPVNRIPRHVTFDGSSRAYFETAPLVGVTAHLGNWEVLGQALSLRGAPPVSVAAPIANRTADGMLTRLRKLTGQRVVKREGALKALVQTLREGGRVGLVMDQNTVPAQGGEFVEFFGLPVPMSRTAASLSAKTGAPAVFMYCLADGRGGYRVYGRPALRDAGQGATQRLASLTEEAIRAQPEQWMWTYKRWKYVPEGAPRARYPFYARPLRDDER